MTAQVTKFKADGVKAIALTVAPAQTASVAAVAAGAGPGRADPRQQPGLRARPAAGPGGPCAEDEPATSPRRCRRSTSSQTCSRTTRPPTPASRRASACSWAPAWRPLMNQILDTACKNGDLTRAGRARRVQQPEERRHRRPRRPDPGLREGQVAQPAELRAPAGRRSRAAPSRSQDATEGESRRPDRRLTALHRPDERRPPHPEGAPFGVLLEVALDLRLGAGRGLVGVLAVLPLGPPLPQQVPALVEVRLELGHAGALLGGVLGCPRAAGAPPPPAR